MPFTHHITRQIARAVAVIALATSTASAQSLPGTIIYSAPGGTIRDNLVTTFSFTVTETNLLPATGGITVRFRDFLDVAAGDLRAVLAYTAPGQSSVTRQVALFDFAAGGFNDRAFDGSYSVGSSFALALPSGLVPSGDYALVGSLSPAFVGQSIAGSYEVQFYDAFSNGGATVGGVDLAFDVVGTTVAPEPSTVALLGAGLLGVFTVGRRRRPVPRG